MTEFCRRNELSLVFITKGQKNDFPSVMIDDRNGAGTGIRHLLANGHRRLAVITSDHYPERLADAREALNMETPIRSYSMP